ncbi:MAG: RDD family protein [Burkholderiaceae bacterium]
MSQQAGQANTIPFSRATPTSRLAAMAYEAVLLLGVIFAVSFMLLVSMRWSYPLTAGRRAALQLVVFIAVGAYFVYCWTRTGQTLALKTWRLKVISADESPLGVGRAIARYLLAWHLWIPGLAVSALLELNLSWTLIALATGFAVLLTSALIDPQRRLLHDRWTGTRIVRVPE